MEVILIFWLIFHVQASLNTSLAPQNRMQRELNEEEEDIRFYILDKIRNAPINKPCRMRFAGTLKVGHTVRVRGMFYYNTLWTDMNLLDGNDKHVLQMSFRFKYGTLVLNSDQGRNVGDKRVTLPYKPGDSFIVRLRLKHKGYEIWCNDNMVHMYKHSLPLSRVKYLEVTKNAVVYNVDWFEWVKVPVVAAYIDRPLLRLNSYVEVNAIPKGRFNVDLIAEDGSILFHFNARFVGRGGMIVRNTNVDGYWEDQESDFKFPFKIDQSFLLRIQNDDNKLQYFVDGRYLGHFKHRTDDPDQNYVEIKVYGEIDVISLICSEGPWDVLE